MQLAFNRETCAVAIRAASAGTAGAYRLRRQLKGIGRQITGKRFFAHFGLDTSTSHTFEGITFGEGLVGFRLETPAAVAAAVAIEAELKSTAKPKTRAARKAT